MRREVRDHQHRVGRIVADVHLDNRTVQPRDAADHGERPVHPLIVLDAAMHTRVEHRDVERIPEGLGLQLNPHRVVVGIDDAHARGGWVGADEALIPQARAAGATAFVARTLDPAWRTLVY